LWMADSSATLSAFTFPIQLFPPPYLSEPGLLLSLIGSPAAPILLLIPSVPHVSKPNIYTGFFNVIPSCVTGLLSCLF
jgi:hypothetical protein